MKQTVYIKTDNGEMRGTLYDFVVKFDITYGLVDFGGGHIEEIELDKIRVVEKV